MSRDIQTIADLIALLADADDDTLIDERTAAALLDVAAGTLSVWRCTGRYDLEFIKVGRNVRYRLGTVRKFRRSHTFWHTGQFKAVAP
jgi:hypothetical protein